MRWKYAVSEMGGPSPALDLAALGPHLGAMGAQGWELVQIIPLGTTQAFQTMYPIHRWAVIFKAPEGTADPQLGTADTTSEGEAKNA